MQPIIEHLASEIKQIYEQSPGQAPAAIEEYLNRQFQGVDNTAKIQFVSLLTEAFCPPPEQEFLPERYLQQEYLVRFCSLILGKTLTPEELSTTETLERLSQALNTIFDSLNQLVHSIRITLFLDSRIEETIRHVIGSSLNTEVPSASLEQYLGEIRTAFFLSHQAFKSAAGKMFDRILQELNPEKLAQAEDSGFMFGPMKKAHAHDRYRQIFATCRQWHDSGRAMEDFLKEFEKECQTLSQQIRR